MNELTENELRKVDGTFDNLLGRLAGFIDPDLDPADIESELLLIVKAHAGSRGHQFYNHRLGIS